MRDITKQELKEILNEHKLWLKDSSKGKKADLSSANLRSVDFRFADLSSAKFSSANLRFANLNSAKLSSADFSSANLSSANLIYANLSSSNLSSANLSSANLSSSNLSSANLSSANLSSSNLSFANLRSSDLSFANLRFADLSSANILIFQYQRHPAYCTGERLIIGCEDRSLVEWSSEFERIGKDAGYTELQIAMYGKFIEMCIEHNGITNDQ